MENQQQTEREKRFSLVDFLAAKPKIEELLARGYSAKAVWRQLKEKKLFVMSYSQFMRYVADQGLKTRGHSTKSALSSLKPPPAPSPSRKHEPWECLAEEKPKRAAFNLSTIGKEHLMDPFDGKDKK